MDAIENKIALGFFFKPVMGKLLIEVLKNNLDFYEKYLKDSRGGLGQIGY